MNAFYPKMIKLSANSSIGSTVSNYFKDLYSASRDYFQNDPSSSFLTRIGCSTVGSMLGRTLPGVFKVPGYVAGGVLGYKYGPEAINSLNKMRGSTYRVQTGDPVSYPEAIGAFTGGEVGGAVGGWLGQKVFGTGLKSLFGKATGTPAAAATKVPTTGKPSFLSRVGNGVAKFTGGSIGMGAGMDYGTELGQSINDALPRTLSGQSIPARVSSTVNRSIKDLYK